MREVQQVDVPLEDEGKLLGQQLVEADAVVVVQPALAAPIVALRPAATEKELQDRVAGMFCVM